MRLRTTDAVFRRDEDDVELLIAAVARHHGDEIARRRRLDRDRARVVGFFRVRRQVLAVVGRPLLVAERLEAVFQIFLELLVELARRHLERFFVRARAAADGALAQREEELPHAVLAPARFDELVERVAEVVDQARAAEVAVAFHLAHARDDVGDRRVAHGHQIERIPDAALVFGAAFMHPQRDVAAEQRHRDEVVLEDVRQLVDDQPVEQVRRQIDRQHHAVALAFGEREHAFLRGARRDVLLLELAVRLEDDERHALVEVVPQVRADLLIRALGVARDPLEVPLVFGVVVDLEVVGLVDVPLELVVVDLVLAVIRRHLRLRVDGAALRVENATTSRATGSQPLRVRLTCGCQSEAAANKQMEALRETRMRIRSPREINGVATGEFSRSYCDHTAYRNDADRARGIPRSLARNHWQSGNLPLRGLRISA